MRGNTFGEMLSCSTFGESHGPAMGALIDGVPPGLKVSLEDLQKELDRRAPGRLKGTTSRTEGDQVELLSGVFKGKSLGTPIMAVVRNTNQRSADYDKLEQEFRPGHADETTMAKFGVRDHRGGGRSSGRETLARVIAGYFAGLVLPQVKIDCYISSVGHFNYEASDIDLSLKRGPYNLGKAVDENEFEKFLIGLKGEGNSIGGKLRLHIQGCPAGLGEPVFEKLKSELSMAFMSIGAVTGVTYGACEDFTRKTGKELTQNRSSFGGIEGGISTGGPIIWEVSVRPPSTVGKKALEGRHDPCILPRVVPVVESMAKLVLADHFLRQQAYL